MLRTECMTRARRESLRTSASIWTSLCRLAAREMIAVALEAERRAYLEIIATPRSWMPPAAGSWSATATLPRATITTAT